MSASSDRSRWEAALASIEAELKAAAASLDLLAERGLLLARLGRAEEAKAQYLEVLQRDATHFHTLNNLGALLAETGFTTAARTVFIQAVAHHPHEPTAHVNLADLLMYADEFGPARAHYEAALRLDPANAQAHQRLSALLHELGDIDGMRRHRALGFGAAPADTLPFLGEGAPIPLLVLTSTPAGDVSWRKLVDDRVFATTALAAAFHAPDAPLPPHAMIFNVIGDADLCAEDLKAAEALCRRSGAPVLNAPDRIPATGRMAGARRLGALSGVVAPRMSLWPRAALEADDAAARLEAEGFGFPLLVRSPGFHTGRHFEQVDEPGRLSAVAAALPGPELMVIEHLDTRGPDGLARKYRVMIIDGRLYPLHLVVSRHWKAHYFTGAMGEDAEHREEEARFLEAMPEVLGPRAMRALEAIGRTLGLDYAGVDFAVGQNGELLLFEANAVMNMIAPDASPQWDYRRPAITRAIGAARDMLVRRAATATARATPPGY
jgi:hypothetical protein